MDAPYIPEFQGNLRSFMLRVPECIQNCTGIRVFGKRIRSLVFTTDVSIIRNCNADAVIAVYPFTPQPLITQAVMQAADMPVFAGVGGGLTQGMRVVDLALHAEFQGAMGVVVNAPTKNETVRELTRRIDIPVVVTVVSEHDDIEARVAAGTKSSMFRLPQIRRTLLEIFVKAILSSPLLPPEGLPKTAYSKPLRRAQTPSPGRRRQTVRFLKRLWRHTEKGNPTRKCSHQCRQQQHFLRLCINRLKFRDRQRVFTLSELDGKARIARLLDKPVLEAAV